MTLDFEKHLEMAFVFLAAAAAAAAWMMMAMRRLMQRRFGMLALMMMAVCLDLKERLPSQQRDWCFDEEYWIEDSLS